MVQSVSLCVCDSAVHFHFILTFNTFQTLTFGLYNEIVKQVNCQRKEKITMTKCPLRSIQINDMYIYENVDVRKRNTSYEDIL